MAFQINCDESKPYIFVSYAHKDSDRVYPILERLSEVGFNIWFDKGIEAGSTWDDNIASHIDSSTYFMAFVSENYLNSNNCKDEISYSRDLDKDMLLVYLDEVALPSGMAMRLNRNQAVIWNEKDDLYNNEDFSKILNAKGISKTRVNKSSISLSETAASKAAAPTTVSEAIPPVSRNIPSANVQAANVQSPIASAINNKNRRVIIISAISVGIVCLTIGLIVVFSSIRKRATSNYDDVIGFNDEIDYAAEQAEINEKYKDAHDAEVIGFGYRTVDDVENKESYVAYWAQIKNPNQNVFIKNVTLKLTLRGTDGTIINTSEDYYSDILSGDTVSVLGRVDSIYGGKNIPSEVTCEVFSTEFGDNEDSVKTVYSDIEFFNLSTRAGEYDTFVITGEVNYNTKADDDYLNAIVILNKDGKCVFTDSLSISDVKPGKTQAFSAEVYTEVPEFDEIILLPEKRW